MCLRYTHMAASQTHQTITGCCVCICGCLSGSVTQAYLSITPLCMSVCLCIKIVCVCVCVCVMWCSRHTAASRSGRLARRLLLVVLVSWRFLWRWWCCLWSVRNVAWLVASALAPLSHPDIRTDDSVVVVDLSSPALALDHEWGRQKT